MTLQRTGSLTAPITFKVFIDDPTELEGPSEGRFEADQSEVPVPLRAIDDGWADGAQEVELRVSALGFQEAITTITVLDDNDDPPGLVINEVYANDREDANEDGEGDLDGPGFDEFVEIINPRDAPWDLSGYTLEDAIAVRHRFPKGTVLQAGCAIVVFGGGSISEGHQAAFGGALVQKANGANQYGLGLNNSADHIRILDHSEKEVAGFAYNQEDLLPSWGSLTRYPDGSGPIVSHLDIQDGPAIYSFTPGHTSFGDPFCTLAQRLSLTTDRSMVSEDAGEDALRLTIAREGSLDQSVTVHLLSSDPGKLIVPQSVSFPIGREAMEVPITAVDDHLDNATTTVTLTANAPDFLGAQALVQVLDDGDPTPRLIINELDAAQPGSDDGEFIELYDGGLGHLPLDGWTLVLFNGATDAVYASFDLAEQHTDRDGYFVLGDSGVLNVSWSPPRFTIQNGLDAVALYRKNDDAWRFPVGSFPPDEDQGLVDAVVYGDIDSTTEASTLIDQLTPSVALAQEDHPTGNDTNVSIGRHPRGASAEDAIIPFLSMTPTPGKPNQAIPETTYAQWAARHGFPAPESESTSGDPDRDGLPNALEYALDTDPLRANPKRLSPRIAWPQTMGMAPQETTPLLSVALPPGPEMPNDVSLELEMSADLRSWVPLPANPDWREERILTALSSEFLTPGPSSFIRVVVHIHP